MGEVIETRERQLTEKDVVARISRYSALRAAERALRPSVRRRKELPTASMGQSLLLRLQSLLEKTREGRSSDEPEGGPPCPARDALDGLDEELEGFAQQLREAIERTPLVQLRATLPSIAEKCRMEIAALLDFCIEHAEYTDGPPYVVDYLVTLLCTGRGQGPRMLLCDPTSVSPLLTIRSRLYMEQRDQDDVECAAKFALAFREAAMEVLLADDIDSLVLRMRELKGRLGKHLFDSDVLRSLVNYNLAVGNRFRILMELEREHDAAVQDTLAALKALDNRPSSSSLSALQSPGLRAVEEALLERLSGVESTPGAASVLAGKVDLSQLSEREVRAFTEPVDDNVCALLRAAVVVGLALRDLPSLAEQLRQLSIDDKQLRDGWARELDQVLITAIHALTRVGHSDEASQLAHTRMRFLSAA